MNKRTDKIIERIIAQGETDLIGLKIATELAAERMKAQFAASEDPLIIEAAAEQQHYTKLVAPFGKSKSSGRESLKGLGIFINGVEIHTREIVEQDFAEQITEERKQAFLEAHFPGAFQI